MIKPTDGINGWELIGSEVDWELYYNKYEQEYVILDLMTEDSIRIQAYDDIEQLEFIIKTMIDHRIQSNYGVL